MVPNPKDYASRPIIIQAVQLFDHNAEKIAFWCGGSVVKHGEQIVGVNVPSLRGNQLADMNDYVVKGIKGDFVPLRPDLFESLYDTL